MDVLIRIEEQHDVVAVRVVHERAFGRPEEARLVEMLHRGEFVRLSLVAEVGGQVVGHVLFSDLPVHGRRSRPPARPGAAGGPARMAAAGCRVGTGTTWSEGVCRVWSARWSFSASLRIMGVSASQPSRRARLESPYAGPYFQAVELQPGALESVTGAVQYPAPFTEV